MRLFFKNSKHQPKAPHVPVTNLAVHFNKEIKPQPIPKPEKKIISMRREDIEELTTPEKDQIATLKKEITKIELSTYENTFLWSQPLPYEKTKMLEKLAKKLAQKKFVLTIRNLI